MIDKFEKPALIRFPKMCKCGCGHPTKNDKFLKELEVYIDNPPVITMKDLETAIEKATTKIQMRMPLGICLNYDIYRVPGRVFWLVTEERKSWYKHWIRKFVIWILEMTK